MQNNVIMESFEIYCVQEEGYQRYQIIIKTRPKMAPDAHVYWSQQIHVSQNFGLGQPGGHAVPALTQLPHSSLEASVYALFLMVHLELDASSPTAALVSIMWAHTV